MSSVPKEILARGSEALDDSLKSKQPAGLRFWLILISLCLAFFSSSLGHSTIPTALPTITAALNGQSFVWVGSAFDLAALATILMTGGIAQAFGRKPALLGSFAFAAAGSAVCGAAQSTNMIIAGRAIQGIGSGGVGSFSTVILADITSLHERGLYAGIISAYATIGLLASY